MMCRKCGATKIKRRRAGVWECGHCGYQPGPTAMDRSGHSTKVIAETTSEEMEAS